MKAFRWFLLFALTAVVLLGTIIGLNREAFRTIFSNRPALAAGTEFVPQTYSMAGLVGFSIRHPQFVSIVNNGLADSLTDFRLNESAPRVYGNLEAFLTAIALEESGRSSELVQKATFETFLPRGLKEARADAAGMDDLFCSSCAPTFETLFSEAYKSGNQTAADFLKAALSPSDSTLFPFSDSLGIERPLFHWSSLLAFKYGGRLDTPFHRMSDGQKETLLQNEGVARTLSFDEEVSFNQSLPKATVSAWAILLESLVKGTFKSPEFSKNVLLRIASITQTNEERREFITHTAVYHTRLGQLGGAEFGISSFDSTAWINVVQFDNLPVGLWLHMSSNYMNQDFQQRMTWDPGLRRRLHDSLKTISGSR